MPSTHNRPFRTECLKPTVHVPDVREEGVNFVTETAHTLGEIHQIALPTAPGTGIGANKYYAFLHIHATSTKLKQAQIHAFSLLLEDLDLSRYHTSVSFFIGSVYLKLE